MRKQNVCRVLWGDDSPYSAGFMTPVLLDYFSTGLVLRLPTWILSTALLMISLLFFTIGLVLDSLSRARIGHFRLHDMSSPVATYPPFVPEQTETRASQMTNTSQMTSAV